METELKFLFEFQYFINDLQKKIIDARIKKTPEEKIKPMIEIVDYMIQIYKKFDAYYFGWHSSQQKILQVEIEKQDLRNEVLKLKEENLKLLSSLNWKP